MFHHILRSHKGFSIVQAMVIGSVVAGLGYVGTVIMTEQKLNIRGVEQRTNNDRLHQMIYSLVQNKDHCTATFQANGIIPYDAIPTLGATSAFTKITALNAPSAPFTTKSGATYTAAEKYMNNTVGIQSMSFTYPASSFEALGTLSITYERLGQGFSGKTKTEKISIKLQRTLDGKFESCYAVVEDVNNNLVKEFCENLGEDDGVEGNVDSIFEWDPATNSCKLRDLKCPDGQVFVGIDSTGSRSCHRIQEWTNLADFLDTTSAPCSPGSANDVRFVPSTGNKVKVICQSSGGATTGGTTGGGGGGPLDCTTPWGATLSPGASVTAYQSASPTCPDGCVSETRTCASDGSGVLSGSYTNAACTAPGGSCCMAPWGAWIAHGVSVNAYLQAGYLTPPEYCKNPDKYEVRTCNNGDLSGAGYVNWYCYDSLGMHN
jgi:hypothetical protein